MTVSRHKQHTAFFILLSLFFTINVASCKAPQDEFGADADYFIGLQKLAEDKQNEARKKFNHCIKKGTSECARKSAQMLTTFGTTLQKNNACISLVEKFDDEQSKLIAAKQFKKSGETNRIADITTGIDLEKADNELIKYRLEALEKRNDSHLPSETFNWFISRPVSLEHYQFYRDTYRNSEPGLLESPENAALNYRILIYKRNYLEAYSVLPDLFQLIENKQLEAYPQLISDIGKAILYGDADFYTHGNEFTQLAEEFKNTPAEFYFWFYAGRYFDQAGFYYKQSVLCYENAMNSTKDEAKKDNALWYLLKAKTNQNLDSTVSNIGQYAKEWSDPEYFDDYFDSLIPTLIIGGKWKLIKPLINQIDGYATNEVVAQLSYIYGRLIEKNIISVEDKDEELKKTYERALNCGSASYYKIAAAYQLGMDNGEVEKILCSPVEGAVKNINADAEKLLKGYVKFGFPEKIYEEWKQYSIKEISTDTCMYLSDFLQRYSEQKVEYAPVSLRIASKAAFNTDRPLTMEELKLVYPKPYEDLIENIALHYEIEPAVMFGLIRSESFFDAEISSYAGAVGLTQLMDFTAGDVARKLRIRDYSLTDPQTNIEFGTFYLAEMLRRCDYSYLQAFFSYNAGFTKISRLRKGYLAEFGQKSNMPDDIFLEALNISETREYGRKLVSASVYYDYLYNTKNKSFTSITAEFIDN